MCSLLARECLAADAPIGRISHVYGAVTIERPGRAKAVNAARGDDFFVGDVVTTAEDSAAQATFSDDSFMNLAPGTSVRVSQYSYDSRENRRTVAIRVLNGTARFVVRRPRAAGSAIRVETKSAQVVSGGLADFAVAASNEATDIVALDAAVSVKNTSSLVVGEVFLGANQRTRVREKSPPTQPEVVTPEERRRYAVVVRRS